MSKGPITHRRSAAADLRALLKGSAHTKAEFLATGAVDFLVDALQQADDGKVREHAVTALFNVALHPGATPVLVACGGIEAVVGVLRRGGSMGTRENAAATLFNLSIADGAADKVRAAGAVPLLVDLLRTGSTRGRKDAALVLFNLSRDEDGAKELVTAGAVEVLVDLLTFREVGLVEKVMAVTANVLAWQTTVPFSFLPTQSHYGYWKIGM
ncbi:unnamed protein product [Closterium sp. NIES-65]|nr:unnamed protein product [Closterium sp. NIES-65]